MSRFGCLLYDRHRTCLAIACLARIGLDRVFHIVALRNPELHQRRMRDTRLAVPPPGQDNSRMAPQLRARSLYLMTSGRKVGRNEHEGLRHNQHCIRRLGVVALQLAFHVAHELLQVGRAVLS